MNSFLVKSNENTEKQDRNRFIWPYRRIGKSELGYPTFIGFKFPQNDVISSKKTNEIARK